MTSSCWSRPSIKWWLRDRNPARKIPSICAQTQPIKVSLPWMWSWRETISHTSSNGAKRPMPSDPAGLQGPPLGGGTNPFLVQSLPQIAGEFRENQSQLRRATRFGRSHDLLEANNSYSRISS